MSASLLQNIESSLLHHRPSRARLRRFRKRSAVAMILQIRNRELHILMIKRAEREGDPWSGHMAFPGGRMEAIDAHGFDVAVRETQEEVGLRLGPTDPCIGRLSDRRAGPRRIIPTMSVSPFVFRLERDVKFSPNYEVAEVVWVPMKFLLDRDNREEMIWQHNNLKIRMPCYFFGERRIWGLSLRMLDELMELQGVPAAR